MEEKTSVIKVSDKLWKFLNSNKIGTGDTFEDVIWRLTKVEPTPEQIEEVKSEMEQV